MGMRLLSLVLTVGVASPVFAQDDRTETKVRRQDLPVAVQRAIEGQSQGARLRGFTKEVDAGRTLYEAEMVVAGRTRDVTFDEQGNVVSVEEETTLAAIPAAAREALQKAAAGGRITLVERLEQGGTTSYEAHLEVKGKALEIKVDPNGKRIE
jgi:uncharacterized membrane protein YkoI